MSRAMDAETIVFVGADFSLGYNIEYFNTNYTDIVNKINDAEDIYYKVNDNRSSWLDYKQTVVELEGTLEEKIFEGLNLYSLSSELNELPEVIFTDKIGFEYDITAQDGLADRINSFIDSTVINPISQSLNVNNNLEVTFGEDVTDCIISMGGLFWEHTRLTDTKVVFDKSIFDDGTIDPSITVKAFRWENIFIEDEVRALSITDSLLELDSAVDENHVAIYNGVIYNYDISPQDNTKIYLEEIDANHINFDYTKVKLLNFSSEVAIGFDITRVTAIIDEETDRTFFDRRVDYSLILYNGVYHMYEANESLNYIDYSAYEDLNEITEGSICQSISIKRL